MLFYVLSVALFLVTWFLLFRKKHADCSGPSGLPYIGNLFQLGQFPHITLTEWAKKHGRVYKIKIFGNDIVVLNNEASIREALVTKSDAFAGRPYVYRQKYILKDEIFFGSLSPRWSLLKKHCMMGLKLVGDGVKRLELLASGMVDHMVTIIEEKQGQPFNPKPLMHETVCRINATLIFGWELSEEEEKDLFHLDNSIPRVNSTTTAGFLLDKFPWLRFFPNKLFSEMESLKAIYDTLFESAIQKTIQLVKESDNHESAMVDVIKLSAKSHNDISNETLKGTALDLLAAGNITTSTFITGFIAVLINDQTLQKQCQTRVDDVLQGRPPTLADRAALPYMESLILELLRYFSHVPLLIPHMTTKDTEVAGHLIPKGVEVLVNSWNLHHDPTLWKDPWTIIPERFLDEEGKLVAPDHPLRKRLFPFGAGRRVCVGEALARNRLFLFVCTMLQKFTFLPEIEGVLAPADPRIWKFGLACNPDDFNIRAISR